MPRQYTPRVTLICKNCHKGMSVTAYQAIRGAKFCCRACKTEYYRSEYLERFMDNVSTGTSDECWIWHGTIRADGYGQIKSNDRLWTAHRLSYTIHVGHIPEGKIVLHKCDVPLCVNPHHLVCGTTLDNVADKVAKGRQPKGEAIGMSKLTEEDVRAIRLIHGMTHSEIARLYGIDASNVGMILQRKTWRHVR